MTVQCVVRWPMAQALAGEVINHIEAALRAGVPKAALVDYDDALGVLVFSWEETR